MIFIIILSNLQFAKLETSHQLSLNKASESVFHYEKIVNTAACADYMVSLNKLINHAAGSSVHHLANGREAMLAMPHWLFLLRDIQM